MILDPKVDAGYALLHDGAIALSEVESNGIRMNVQYVDATIESLTKKISEYQGKVRASNAGRLWQKKFGFKTNFGSNEQLAEILFTPKEKGGLGYVSEVRTKSGKYSTEEEVLSRIESKFIQKYLKIGKYEKVLADMKGLKREIYGVDRLHGSYNLHTTKTYRSSANDPNFQNQQTRNDEMARIIRESFIASEGCVLVENDCKGVEVSVAACYHKDPVMLSYIQDESKDMHRDMAMQIYCLSKQKWDRIDPKIAKAIRHAAKNQFVFPEFYGDWWLSCGRCLWEAIDQQHFKGPDGEDLKEHLRDQGITELGDVSRDDEGHFQSPEEGTFLRHIQEVENDFWNNRFKVYGAWKKKWFEKYEERGWFDTYTGFHISGSFKKNQVINYPVQGSAFHCLLWSLIRIQKELRQKKMKTKIVGQIHDSIIADVRIEEIDEYLAIVKRVTSIDIRKEFKWLIIPLVIECEISPIGKSWYHKQEVKYKENGLFENKDATFKGTARELLKYWQNDN